MPVIRSLSGVLVEKSLKTFEDGTGGAFCVILTKENKMRPFWCPQELVDELGEPESVEYYEDSKKPCLYTFRVKLWNDKEKWTLEMVRG